MISTWVGFYHDVEYEGCQQVIHFPCVDGSAVPFQDIGVLFRPTKDTIGFLSFHRSFDTDRLAREFEDLVGEPLLRCNNSPSSSNNGIYAAAVIAMIAGVMSYYRWFAV
jgi:hypothetical protein